VIPWRSAFILVLPYDQVAASNSFHFVWVWTNTEEINDNQPVTVRGEESAADLQITFIQYDPPRSDVEGEYVRIENVGGGAADMTDWTLRDEANKISTFPTFTPSPGASAQVWTKSGTNTVTDLYWGSGSAIWNNTDDCAYLRDSGGTAVDTYCYL
jgi:hypothetical protein